MDKSAKEAELPLSEIRHEVRTLLARRDHPLLIVMDDIDRLSAEQMKALFQLVKGNMDFPNVVFLLLFQRDIVEQGLERAGFKGLNTSKRSSKYPLAYRYCPLSDWSRCCSSDSTRSWPASHNWRPNSMLVTGEAYTGRDLISFSITFAMSTVTPPPSPSTVGCCAVST